MLGGCARVPSGNSDRCSHTAVGDSSSEALGVWTTDGRICEG
jgi:hypothetical protein